MPASRRPTISQLRRLYLLVGECHELGRDPKLWRRRLAEGLLDLIPDAVALVYELYPSGLADGALEPMLVDRGWTDDGRRDAFRAYLASGESAHNPLLQTVMESPSELVSLRATQVLPEQQWRRLSVAAYIREAGLELDCATTATAHGEKRNVFTVHRRLGFPALSPREQTLVELLHREIRPSLGGALASFGEPSACDLPPSVQAVLFGLLRGESVKESASRLGISEHTARDYGKRIHQHFRVSSRGELLAEFGGAARSPHGQRLAAG